MFTNSDFKMTFGLSIIGSIAATALILINKSWKYCFKTTVSSAWFTLHKTTRTCSTSLVFGVHNYHLCLYTILCYYSSSCGWAKMIELWIRTGRNVFYQRLCLEFGVLKNLSFSNSKRTQRRIVVVFFYFNFVYFRWKN